MKAEFGSALCKVSIVAGASVLALALQRRGAQSRAHAAMQCQLRLPVTVDGTGSDVLVFVHGWPDDERLWDAQVAHLRDQYRCIRVTMPHFGGRALASELGHATGGYDFFEVAEMLAATIRAESGSHPVTLVLHDWGCVWGFLMQRKYPELVKAIVAMDVGTPTSMKAGISSLPMLFFAGLAYQYWLLAAYIVGGPIGDWMARSFVRIARPKNKRYGGLDMVADYSSGRITSDACYPYYFFQRGLGVRSLVPFPSTDELDPSCPCLFLYGRRKPFMFHGAAWLQHLEGRPDCKVVAIDSGHWLQLERPEEVNDVLLQWLSSVVSEPRARL